MNHGSMEYPVKISFWTILGKNKNKQNENPRSYVCNRASRWPGVAWKDRLCKLLSFLLHFSGKIDWVLLPRKEVCKFLRRKAVRALAERWFSLALLEGQFFVLQPLRRLSCTIEEEVCICTSQGKRVSLLGTRTVPISEPFWKSWT
jgi:hypothetical protein